MLSNSRKRACSGSSAGGVGSPGSLSFTSDTTWAMSAAPGPIPDINACGTRARALAEESSLQPGPQLAHLLLTAHEDAAGQPVKGVRLLLARPPGHHGCRLHRRPEGLRHRGATLGASVGILGQ